MLQLPFGCSCSDLTVNPANWQTAGKEALRKKWFIQYYFYDPRFREDPKYRYGKFVMVKGMNKFTTLAERREATRRLLKAELELLQQDGYNPITKKLMLATTNLATDIPPTTGLNKAMELAAGKITVERHTREDINSTLRYFGEASEQLGLDTMPVSEIRQKHIKLILEQCGRNKNSFSNHRFNKYRSYLMILFRELVQLEAVSTNPVKDLAKLKTTRTLRPVLSDKERRLVDEHLRNKVPVFHRFLHIFFHSGGRLTELMRVKVKDVSLERQRYKCTIKKGREFREVERTIKDVALPLWQEQINGARATDYVFSVGLEAGPKAIRTEQITRRWKTHVKDELGIEADFYSLKHLNTDETAALLSLEDAAKHNSHTSTKITKEHYALGEQERQHLKLKLVNNRFA